MVIINTDIIWFITKNILYLPCTYVFCYVLPRVVYSLTTSLKRSQRTDSVDIYVHSNKIFIVCVTKLQAYADTNRHRSLFCAKIPAIVGACLCVFFPLGLWYVVYASCCYETIIIIFNKKKKEQHRNEMTSDNQELNLKSTIEEVIYIICF